MNVLFFGPLAELVGKNSIRVKPAGNVNQLKEKIFSEFPPLQTQSFLIAVNKKVQHENVRLQEGDEVAFLPPFSGG